MHDFSPSISGCQTYARLQVARSQDVLSDRRLPKWQQDTLRLDEYLTQQLLALDTIQATSATRERVRELRRALVARIDAAHTVIDSIKVREANLFVLDRPVC